MATVAVTLTSVSNKASSGLNSVMPTADAASTASTTVASSAVSAQASITCPDDGRQHYWVITTLGNIWVAFGDNPTAAAGDDYLVASGSTRDFAARPGQKCAVVDAT